jgi:transcriptional regulator NrdR family protein
MVSCSPSDFMARVHREMGELKRRRVCQSCGYDWATIELPMEELQRLRGLACRARLDGL